MFSDNPMIQVWTAMAVCLLFLYLLPTLIALFRLHRSFFGIMIVNIFAGWSVLGWVAALIWAVAPTPTVKVIDARKH